MKFSPYPINNEVLNFDKGASWWANIVDTKSLNSTKILVVIFSMYFNENVNSTDALINIFLKKSLS